MGFQKIDPGKDHMSLIIVMKTYFITGIYALSSVQAFLVTVNVINSLNCEDFSARVLTS